MQVAHALQRSSAPALQRSSAPALQRSSAPALQRSSLFLRARDDAPSRFQRIVGVALGCVLLAAAVLKLQEVLARTAPPAALFELPSPLAELLIGFESLLGWWLISGVAAPKARSTALLTFALFSGVSFAALVAGEPRCGCFGNLEISPLVTCIVDATAVLALRWAGRAAQAERGPQLEATA